MSTTRRALLRGTLAGGAAWAAIALEGRSALADAPPLLRGANGDAELLFRLLQYEQVAAFSYAHIERSAALSARARGTVARYLGQEHRHAQLLTAAMSARHETAYAPTRGMAAAEGILAELGVTESLQAVHGEDAAVRLLIAIETAGENLYYAAIERLSSPSLLSLAGEILGCEGQHWSGLSALLHPEQPGNTVPHAFVPLVGQFSG